MMLNVIVESIRGVEAEIDDYRYDVLVDLRPIAVGGILRHRRSDGWAVLLKRIADLYIDKSQPAGPDIGENLP